MYRSLVLVDPASDISTKQLCDELRRFYAGKDRAPGRIDLSDHTLTLHWTGYALMAVCQTAPHVLTESQEIADEFAQHHVARDRIARCAARFELSAGVIPKWRGSTNICSSARRWGVTRRMQIDGTAGCL